MTIICGPETATISFTDTLVCNKLVKIDNIQPMYPDRVDLVIESQIILSVYNSGDAIRVGAEIWTVSLISKDVSAGTAVIKLTVSQDPCVGVVCPDVCIGADMYRQRCAPQYDSNLVPMGSNCVTDTLKQAASPACKATHFLDVVIKPYSWYNPGGAATEIIKKIVDLNGALANLFSGITEWKYLGIDVLTQGDKVVIRAYLQELSLMVTTGEGQVYTMLAPVAVLIEQIASIAIIVLAIVIAVGFVVGVYLITSSFQSIFGKDFTKQDVGNNAVSTITKSETDCNKNFLPGDPIGYANCVKSGVTSITAGLGDLLGNSDITNAGKTAGAEIDKCAAGYNIDKDAQKLYYCTQAAIEPVKTLIAQKTSGGNTLINALVVGVVVAGVLGAVYFATRKPTETKIFFQRAAEAVKAPMAALKMPPVLGELRHVPRLTGAPHGGQ